MHPRRAARLLIASTLMAVLACADARRPTARAGVEAATAPERKSVEKEKKDSKDEGLADLGDLNAEVTVLQVLLALDASPAQLAELRAAAARTMQKPPLRKPIKVSEKYRKALRQLRDALLAGEDEKAEEAGAELEELGKKEMPDFEEIELTSEARARAPALLRQFNARQVAGYLATVADFPDPVERLEAGLKRSRELRGKAWREEREATAFQVGWLIAGVDAEAEKKARAQADALLERAGRMEDKEYEGKREALRKEARELVGKLGPMDILRHFMERVLAETLSNHRLAAALEGLRKKK